MAAKLALLAPDPFELGDLRRRLNLGHCIGQARSRLICQLAVLHAIPSALSAKLTCRFVMKTTDVSLATSLQQARCSRSCCVAKSNAGDSPTPPAVHPPAEAPETRPALKPIPGWVISVGVPVMVLIGVAAIWVLIDTGAGKDQLDAIRTGGTLGVGLGGVVALWLAVRKQRSTELDLLQKYDAHELARTTSAETLAHQHKVAEDAHEDVIARRITDLYRQGVEQLGDDKAPVRLGGLYALERLAQDNKDPLLRQTTVNVICAYLRMPAPRPERPISRPLGRRRTRVNNRVTGPSVSQLKGKKDDTEVDVGVRQEREVRLTAERILQAHLKPGATPAFPGESFWPNISLNLTGATLFSAWNLSGSHVDNLDVAGARFEASVNFAGARVMGNVSFNKAHFSGRVQFDKTRFEKTADFKEAVFRGPVSLSKSKFDGLASFSLATFGDVCDFSNAEFKRDSAFMSANFSGDANFSGARFGRKVTFRKSVYDRGANFQDLEIRGTSSFVGSHYAKLATFQNSTFYEASSFAEVEMLDFASFEGADFRERTCFVDAKFGNVTSFKGTRFIARTLICGRHSEHTSCWARSDLRSVTDESAWPLDWVAIDSTPQPLPSLPGLWVLLGDEGSDPTTRANHPRM
ncbi:pentapeptide repeat-containing protein [Amycolatopsis magusensis]|uniref:pentapeptide repeat-containing protein n=1 Tax=Amycolatopsis magusensis TaxID=882444 RepID=UPI0037A8725C